MKSVPFLVLLVGVLALMTPAAFADIHESSPCPTSLRGCFELSGTITDLDVRAVQAIEKTPKDSWGPSIYLNSNGGSVDAAMQIGRYLRELRAHAIMEQQHICYSSCVFVLAGAVGRFIGGKVGIHRPYSERTGLIAIEDAQSEYSRLTKVAKAYLSEMNLPEELYEAMLRTPPEAIRILDDQELASFGLNQQDPVQQEVDDSRMAKWYGISKQEYLRRRNIVKLVCDDTPDWPACHNRVMGGGKASHTDWSQFRPLP